MSRGIQRNLEPCGRTCSIYLMDSADFRGAMNNFAKGSEFGKQTATSVPGPWAALSLCLSGNAVTKGKVCVCCSEVVLQPREVWHLCWYWYSLHTCVIRSIFCIFLGKLEKIPLKYDLWKISEHLVLIVNNWISIQSRDHFAMQSRAHCDITGVVQSPFCLPPSGPSASTLQTLNITGYLSF